MEMYILIPVRDLGDKVPHFDVLSIWIRGFACMNLVHGLLHVLPTNTFQVNLTQVKRMNQPILSILIHSPYCRHFDKVSPTWISSF